MTSEVVRLPRQRIEDILEALFGLYCDSRTGQVVLDNIRGLAPSIWRLVSEDLRLKVGARYGYHRANGDIPRKERVQEFLNAVDGNSYKDEDSLGAELIEKLQFLRSAHYGINNFYNEFPHAKSIAQSLPNSGIPRAARRDFVKVVSTCYIGNGNGYRNGVDENAVPFYNDFVARFDDADIATFVTLFSDHEFTSDLNKAKPRERAVALCRYFASRTSNVLLLNALTSLINNAHVMENVRHAGEYQRAVAELLRSMSAPSSV